MVIGKELWCAKLLETFLSSDLSIILLKIPPPRGRCAAMPRKETRKKEIRKKRIGAEDTPSAPTQTIDARMGEEQITE